MRTDSDVRACQLALLRRSPRCLLVSGHSIVCRVMRQTAQHGDRPPRLPPIGHGPRRAQQDGALCA